MRGYFDVAGRRLLESSGNGVYSKCILLRESRFSLLYTTGGLQDIAMSWVTY